MAKTKNSSAAKSSAVALRAWLAVVRAYNECDAVLTRQLGDSGYSTAQYEVVTRLHREPGPTQQDLAQRCFVAKSGISMLIQRMEADGWVVRSADALDARVKRLVLTPDGRQHAKRMLQIQTEVVGAMASTLTDAQLLELVEMMGNVSNSLRGL